jgi:DNA polymerase-3 subunit alpha
MIAGVRTINTKKGDQMAFVQIEDMGGQGEVVVFPRTYAEVKEMLVLDSIVMVKGKAQTREGQTSLLADSFQNYVDQIVSIGPDPQYQKPLLDTMPTINGFHMEESRMTGDDNSLSTLESVSETMGRNGFGGLDAFGDDDDPSYMEENPFANEPPSWVKSEPSMAAPARTQAPSYQRDCREPNCQTGTLKNAYRPQSHRRDHKKGRRRGRARQSLSA